MTYVDGASKEELLRGERTVVELGSDAYPQMLLRASCPPQRLFVVGNPDVLQLESISIVGARKATPYGLSCAKRFASIAAAQGLSIVSGGARGCDSEAHRAAIASNAPTVVFLGGGCDRLYPARNKGLFQRVLDAGGAVVSEHEWDFPPVPFAHRARNRLIAGLSKATLIVEAGLPSGTFSTADEALVAGNEVLAVPGAISSASSKGSNRLILQGALPVIDDESFVDALASIYGQAIRSYSVQQQALPGRSPDNGSSPGAQGGRDALLEAIRAEPLGMERLCELARCIAPQEKEPLSWLMIRLVELERAGAIKRYPDGRFGPLAKSG